MLLFLLIFLDSTLKNYLELTLFLDVTVRVMDICNRSYFISFTFVIVTKKSMTSLIADVLLLVITLSGVLRGLSSNIENLLPLIGAKSFAFAQLKGLKRANCMDLHFSSRRDLVLGVHNGCQKRFEWGGRMAKVFFQSYRPKI